MHCKSVNIFVKASHVIAENFNQSVKPFTLLYLIPKEKVGIFPVTLLKSINPMLLLNKIKVHKFDPSFNF